MTNKPWLSQYPDGVEENIDLDQYASLNELIAHNCERYADRVAFSNFGAELTYTEVAEQARNFAAWLQSQDLNPGDRVAIMMPNILQYPIALFGILKAGLVVVNTNPMYTPRELKHQLEDAEVKAIVVVENFAHVLEKVVDGTACETVITTRIGDMLGFPKGLLTNFVLKHIKKMVPDFNLPGSVSFTDCLEAGRDIPLKPVNVTQDDLAFLQYTGGTTGVAKGAMLSHGNVVANVLQSEAWFSPIVDADGEIMITALPLYHIFALTCNCFVFVQLGGTNVLITNPRDMDGFVKELGKHRFSAITGVNTLFNGLLNTPGFADLDFSALKMSFGGGMAVQKAVAERWLEVTGCILVQGYGLTETSPVATVNPVGVEEFTGAIGVPAPSTDCAILDSQGQHLGPGEVGELCVRGPQVMKGYWQRPEETEKVMTDDGWLRTGDMGIMEENGYFKLVDRKKDMILVSGFNVYPNEVEDVVAMHPKVLEVAAIGVEDDKSGEVVKLCVVKKDDSLTEDELKAYCKEQLTGYKRPKYVQFYDELPKSNVGKILRKDLRDEANQA